MPSARFGLPRRPRSRPGRCCSRLSTDARSASGPFFRSRRPSRRGSPPASTRSAASSPASSSLRLGLADADSALAEALDRWELSLFQNEPFRSDQLRAAFVALLGETWPLRAAVLLEDDPGDRSALHAEPDDPRLRSRTGRSRRRTRCGVRSSRCFGTGTGRRCWRELDERPARRARPPPAPRRRLTRRHPRRRTVHPLSLGSGLPLRPRLSAVSTAASSASCSRTSSGSHRSPSASTPRTSPRSRTPTQPRPARRSSATAAWSRSSSAMRRWRSSGRRAPETTGAVLGIPRARSSRRAVRRGTSPRRPAHLEADTHLAQTRHTCLRTVRAWKRREE